MKALIHCTTFLEIGSFLLNSIPPTTFHPTIVVARRNWEVQIPLYFLSFPTTFCIFFRLGKPKKFTTVCIPTDGNFPIFENTTLSKENQVSFFLTFQSYSLYSNFLLNVALRHFFSLIRPITALLVNFPKIFVKFPGRQITCIIHKKIFFSMLSVSEFLLQCKTPQTPK